MAISQNIITLSSSTATKITTGATVTGTATGRTAYTWTDSSLIIQNTEASNGIVVYLGTSSVSTTAYGISLAGGTTVTIDSLLPTEDLYAIAASGTPKISILAITR